MTLSPRSSLAVETCCAQGIHMSLCMWQPIHPCFPIQKLARSSVYHFQRDCADVVNPCNNVYVQCNRSEMRLTPQWLLFEMRAVNTSQNTSACPRKFHSAVLQTAWLLLPESKKLQLPRHPPAPLLSVPLITCCSHLTRNRWDQGEHMLWPDGAILHDVDCRQLL